MSEFPPKISRRDFLKLLGVGTATALLSRYSSPDYIYTPSLQEKAIRKNQAVVFAAPRLIHANQAIDEFEKAIDHRVHGVSYFADLDEKPPRVEVVDRILRSGRAIMVNLQPRPTVDAQDTKGRFTPETFIKGQHDAMLRTVAKGMAGFGNSIIFNRFAFEMNMPRSWGFNWGGDPEGFKMMWRYVVGFFRNEGATNVRWIFSVNYTPDQESIGSYYPGDDVVDVIGADIYDKDHLPANYVVNKINYYLRQVAPNKPLIVSELGSANSDRDKWLGDAMNVNLHEGASAINYFQINTDQNWIIDNNDRIPRMRQIFNSGAFLNGDASLQEINKTILTVN